MDTVNSLLDKCRRIRSLASDNALSKELGVTRATVSGWRHGKSQPDPVSSERIARITGEPLARVLGIVGEARAISREEKQVWRKLAGIAAMMMIAVLFVPEAHAGTHEAAAVGSGLLLWILRIMCTTCETEQTATPQGSAHAHRQTALLA